VIQEGEREMRNPVLFALFLSLGCASLANAQDPAVEIQRLLRGIDTKINQLNADIKRVDKNVAANKAAIEKLRESQNSGSKGNLAQTTPASNDIREAKIAQLRKDYDAMKVLHDNMRKELDKKASLGGTQDVGRKGNNDKSTDSTSVEMKSRMSALTTELKDFRSDINKRNSRIAMTWREYEPGIGLNRLENALRDVSNSNPTTRFGGIQSRSMRSYNIGTNQSNNLYNMLNSRMVNATNQAASNQQIQMFMTPQFRGNSNTLYSSPMVTPSYYMIDAPNGYQIPGVQSQTYYTEPFIYTIP
jgi:hypothetical protein